MNEYRISKISEKWDEYFGRDVHDYDTWIAGYVVTLTNTRNPFDFFTQYVPEQAFSESEFEIGRIIELEDEWNEQ